MGYLIRSASETGTRIGPFMAAELTVARALLSRAVIVNRSNSMEVTVPGEGPVHVLLEEFNFVGRQYRLRMELGEAPHTKGLQAYGTTPYLAT